ncbi:hypothetical protein [Flavobacterium sp.]|uniref:hypothetical protein n=1 Tax=Flavobacterium sp. TaxID=239 RepID=UPI0037525334
MKNEDKNIKFDLETIEVSTLPEINGWKEKQELIVTENPFIEISDNKSFEEAKKARTALKSARTTLEKQETLLASKIKFFRTKVGAEIENLILITKPHEGKQQVEIDRYETIKETERIAKEKAEEERTTTHKDNIDLFFTSNKTEIEKLDFETCQSFELNFLFGVKLFKMEDFEEFEDVFETKIELLKIQLAEKKNILQEKEEIRLAHVKIENDRIEMNRVSSIKESIQNYLNYWQNVISNDLTFENHIKTFDKLNNSKDLVCDEFQEDFELKKSTLIKLFASKNSLLYEAENNRLQKIESDKLIEEQKHKVYAIRKSRLAEMGIYFSNDWLGFKNDFTDSFLDPETILNADELSFEDIISSEKESIDKAKTVTFEENPIDKFIDEVLVSDDIFNFEENIELVDEEIVYGQKKQPIEFSENSNVEDVLYEDIILGTPETIGQLMQILSVYNSRTQLNFRNQPRQTLYETVIDNNTVIYFQ